MHVPVETVDKAQNYLDTCQTDSVVAFGGGSTIGLAKALALRAGGSLPIVAVPAAYVGSEMTSIFGIIENNLKTTGRDNNVLPATVIYNPDLPLKLPLHISLFSGVNAMAHAAEAPYAEDRTPVSDMMAGEGIRALEQGMSKLRHTLRDPGARSECLYGAWLCGMLGQVTMGLHHKLCHTLGGTLDLPHACCPTPSLTTIVRLPRRCSVSGQRTHLQKSKTRGDGVRLLVSTILANLEACQ